eukprot:TRINITY_DN265_c1_g1_i11.p2 TRINITY_DN265_c1_g1~~TRINITY_DN265_c1_g1_i11.p2  ORF type:complete len:230 (+),score=35.64 TRINITY_DN265_c1_g1_i11:121-810(+)
MVQPDDDTVSTYTRDYQRPPDGSYSPGRSVSRSQAAGAPSDFEGQTQYLTEYQGYNTEHLSQHRQRNDYASETQQTHGDVDHFRTSAQESYAAPESSAYVKPVGREGAGMEVTHADPDHFRTSKQKDYAAPEASAYQDRAAQPAVPDHVAASTDPDHFRTSKQSDYVAPDASAYQKPSGTDYPDMEVMQTDPQHFRTLAQDNYGAPDPSAYTKPQSTARGLPESSHGRP